MSQVLKKIKENPEATLCVVVPRWERKEWYHKNLKKATDVWEAPGILGYPWLKRNGFVFDVPRH